MVDLRPLKKEDILNVLYGPNDNSTTDTVPVEVLRLAAEWLKQRIRGTIQEELFMLRSDCKNNSMWTDQQIKDLAEASSIRLIDKSFGVVMKK